VVITDADNAQVEAFVAALVQVLRAGTTGVTDPQLNTDPTIYSQEIDADGTPLELASRERQLFFRQLGVALVMVGGAGGGGLDPSLVNVNPGPNLVPRADGTGKLLPGWLPATWQRDLLCTGVTKGRGVYLSGISTVSQGANDTDVHAAIFGVAAATVANGQVAPIAIYGPVTDVLSGAVPGEEYFLGSSGEPVLFNMLVPGNRIIRLGYAVSSTDLEVRITDLGVR